jgi:hypothetical protein
MRLTSVGSGDHHGWYYKYVEVTVIGPHMGCVQQVFTVKQWLAIDVWPQKLDVVINHVLLLQQWRRLRMRPSAWRYV